MLSYVQIYVIMMAFQMPWHLNFVEGFFFFQLYVLLCSLITVSHFTVGWFSMHSKPFEVTTGLWGVVGYFRKLAFQKDMLSSRSLLMFEVFKELLWSEKNISHEIVFLESIVIWDWLAVDSYHLSQKKLFSQNVLQADAWGLKDLSSVQNM